MFNSSRLRIWTTLKGWCFFKIMNFYIGHRVSWRSRYSKQIIRYSHSSNIVLTVFLSQGLILISLHVILLHYYCICRFGWLIGHIRLAWISFLEGNEKRWPELEPSLEILSNFLHQALKRQFINKLLLLIMVDLTKRHRSRLVTMGLINGFKCRSRLVSCLRSKVFDNNATLLAKAYNKIAIVVFSTQRKHSSCFCQIK